LQYYCCRLGTLRRLRSSNSHLAVVFIK